MFRRLTPDPVECRFGGEHAVVSERLRIVTPRYRDMLRVWDRVSRDGDARHWLGLAPADAPVADTPFGPIDPVLIGPAYIAFLGIDAHTGYELAAVTLTRCDDGVYEVGGVVDPSFRARGFGREMLTAVCAVAHQHFGFARLRAGFESTNLASMHWLAAGGFAGFDAPRRHVLPDGREIDSLWWHRTDQSARRRCRNPATA